MDFLNFSVNFICYAAIVGLAIYDGISYWTKDGRDHVTLKGEMTGVGILGTFAGIFIGLVDFKVDDIANSIPPLLEGLKTAFGTSIAGLFFSTGLTVAQAVKPVSFRKTGDPLADTLVRVFQEFEPLMQELRDSARRNTEEMVAMRASMESAMDQLAKGVTREIIAALEKVIADFNSNLQAQFGENFKRLNDACFKLVEWQENHVPTVEKSTGALREAAAAFEVLRRQTETMHQAHLVLMSELRAFGEEATGLAAATERLQGATEAVATTAANADESVRNTARSIGGLDDMVKHALSSIHMQVNGFTRELNEKLKALGAIAPSLDDAGRKAAAAADSAQAAADFAGRAATAAKRNTELTNDELSKAHKNLQDALVALTSTFADAYRNYLEGMRKLTDH